MRILDKLEPVSLMSFCGSQSQSSKTSKTLYFNSEIRFIDWIKLPGVQKSSEVCFALQRVVFESGMMISGRFVPGEVS